MQKVGERESPFRPPSTFRLANSMRVEVRENGIYLRGIPELGREGISFALASEVAPSSCRSTPASAHLCGNQFPQTSAFFQTDVGNLEHYPRMRFANEFPTAQLTE